MNQTLEAPPIAAKTPRLASVFSFSALLTTALLALPFLLCSGLRGDPPDLLRDTDIWWHLRNAEVLLKTHHFIRTDLYSFTTGGKPWINFEWLAELPYYLAYHFSGELGIFVVMFVIVEAILLVVLLLCYRQNHDFKAAFLATAVMVMLATVNLGPRTILFGWLCLVAELLILERFKSGSNNAIWFLPPLFAIWINLHGSWFVGVVLLGLFAASGLISGSWGVIYAEKWTPRQLRMLISAGAAVLVGLLVNPYGWRLMLFPLDTMFRKKLSLDTGVEWLSLDFHAARGKFFLLILISLLLLTLRSRRRWKLHELLFALLAVYSALTYVRFLFLASILLAPVIAAEISALRSRPPQPQRTRPILNAVFIVVIAMIVYQHVRSAAELRAGIAMGFPPAAFQRLKSLDPRSHIFNEYTYGGYMLWATSDVPVFIDPRGDIFANHGVLDDYMHAISLTDTFRVLDKYKIKYVFFPKADPVIYLLEQTPGWKVNYDDGTATIMERVASP